MMCGCNFSTADRGAVQILSGAGMAHVITIWLAYGKRPWKWLGGLIQVLNKATFSGLNQSIQTGVLGVQRFYLDSTSSIVIVSA